MERDAVRITLAFIPRSLVRSSATRKRILVKKKLNGHTQRGTLKGAGGCINLHPMD
ncbi:hypothetical protein SK128_016018, partial [Halocaridina rubra]